MSRKSALESEQKKEKKSKDNFSGQLEGGIKKEQLTNPNDDGNEPEEKHIDFDNLEFKAMRTGEATVNQTFVIRPELKELLDELVFLPNSRKRRPGLKGLLSVIANDGIARELYRRKLISKPQMNELLRERR